MNQKTPYSQLLVIILALALIISCKSEKPKPLSSDLEDLPSNVLIDKSERDPEPYIIDTSKVNHGDPHNLPDSLNDSQILSNIAKTTSDSSVSLSEGEVNTKDAPRKKKKKNKRQPKIEFEELVWDFGEIIEGDIVEKKFKFTNTGNAPLEIIATSATCGCTRPSFPFLAIAPGESNVIGVRYNSVGKNGAQNPEITIESNTKPKITTIKLQGIVKPKPIKDKKATLVNDSIKINQ